MRLDNKEGPARAVAPSLGVRRSGSVWKRIVVWKRKN